MLNLQALQPNSDFKELMGSFQSEETDRSLSMADGITSELSFQPPLDWGALVKFLSIRTAAGVEAFDGELYRRTVTEGDAAGWIEVSLCHDKPAVAVKFSSSLAGNQMPILARLRGMFDLDADPGIISAHLKTLAAQNPGLRVPGSFDGFETAVRAILGQQVTVKGATILMRRFVSAFGEPVETPYPDLFFLTPTSSKVARVDAEAMGRAVGVPLARAKAIVEFARAIYDERVVFDCSIDPEEMIERLKELPGVGDWTAHYMAMRILKWSDAFPYSDLGIKKVLNTTSKTRLIEIAQPWRPWRSYATMHLWRSLQT
jgi:AraC family transcriptional regulator of adaptative response / DNA-3-methyladenine glycosylase II